MSNRKEFCRDCFALVESDEGEWACDLAGMLCKDIVTCEAWSTNKRFATIKQCDASCKKCN